MTRPGPSPIFAGIIKPFSCSSMLKRTGCLLLIALPLLVKGQHYRFEVGMESGPALGKFWSNMITPDHFKTNTHYSLGTFIRYNISGNMGFQTGIYKDMIGTSSNLKMKSSTNKVNISQEVNYITVPLLFRLSFGTKLKGNFTAGGFMSILADHKIIWDYGNHRESFNNTMNTNWFNAGLMWGGGIEYNVIKQMNVGAEVRNQMGFVNMDPKPSLAYFRTNLLQILFKVSYQFKWKDPKEKKQK